MKVLNLISKWFSKTCQNFTLILLILMPFLAAMYSRVQEPAVSIKQVLLFFAFAAAAAVGNLVSDAIKYNTVVKETVKFVIDYASFLAVFIFGLGKGFLKNQSTNQVRTVVFFTFAFVVIYALVGVVCALGRLIVKKTAARDKTPYKKQFEGSKISKDAKAENEK